MYFNSPVTSPPSDVMVVQDGPSSITVTWTTSDTSDSDSGSETISDGSTVTQTIMNLDTYTISIVATSSACLPSQSVTADTTVGLCKSAITLLHSTSALMYYLVEAYFIKSRLPLTLGVHP